jgi:hypothetical protein
MGMAGLLERHPSDQRTSIAWPFQSRLKSRETPVSLVAQGAALSAGPGAFAVVGLPRSFSTVIHSFAQVSCENRREFY